jgi:hypothetical protein
MTLENFRPEVYLIMECLDQGRPIPDELVPWIDLCLFDEVVHYTDCPHDALPSGYSCATGEPTGLYLELTTKGRAAILIRGKSTPEIKVGEQPSRQPADTKEAMPANKLEMALAVLFAHPEWSAAKIARKVGCTGAYLSKQPKWRAARDGIKGLGQEDKRRADRHRGHDMDQYQDDAEQPAPVPQCECGDPAGADAAGKLLVHKGKPRCSQCWAELQEGR